MKLSKENQELLAKIRAISANNGPQSFGGAMMFSALIQKAKRAGMENRLSEYERNFGVSVSAPIANQ